MESLQKTSVNSTPSLHYIERGGQLNEATLRLKHLSVVGLDIETTGLDPLNEKITLIQLGTEEEVYIFNVQKCGASIKALASIISNPAITKIGQNLFFEWTFLEAHGIPLRGLLLDTMIAGKLLDLGLKKPANLEALVRQHLGLKMEDKKELQNSFIGFEGPFTVEQIHYAARDVYMLFPLWKTIKAQLVKESLLHIFKLECRALPAFAAMKHNGFLLDVPYYKELHTTNTAQVAASKQLLMDKLDSKGILDDYKNPETGETLFHPDFHGKGKAKIKGFNPASNPQMIKAFLDYGVELEGKEKVDKKTGETVKSYSIDKNALAWLAPDSEIVRDYLEWKSIDKATSQVKGLIDDAGKYKDGRIRANYRQVGTDTGRVSCSQPNLQQIKRGDEYRRGFIAGPGNVLVIADYSQLELRIAAECSGEQRMIQAYRDGVDLHTKTAALMAGISESEVDKASRSAAKTYNFGALFGSGAKSMRTQAAASGLYLTLEEAQEKLDQWKNAFPQLIGWQKTQGNTVGPVTTLMGRRRKLTKGPNGSDKYTTRLNTQVQGTGGDCMKAALAMLHEKYLSFKPSWKLVANVHDETVMEVPEEDADEAQVILKECMESAAYEVMLIEVPIVAEPGCGKDWSAK